MTKLIKADRDRLVSYDGEEVFASHFQCDSCKCNYLLHSVDHNFCPFCGKEYKEFEDCSV